MQTSPSEQQYLFAHIIDEAVDAWHYVADTHDFPHCNCFRDEFARRLIRQGIFVGFDKIDYAEYEKYATQKFHSETGDDDLARK